MRPKNGKVLGSYGGFHDANIAYIDGDTIHLAIEEERLTRIKAGLNPSISPELSYKEALKLYPNIAERNSISIVHALPSNVNFMSKISGGDYEIETVRHHDSHAYGAYYTSGFADKKKCLVISLDGGGTSALGRYYLGENNKLIEIHRYEYRKNVMFSPADLYSSITAHIGWQMGKDEGKVMGLAGRGKFDQEIYDVWRKIIKYDGEGNFRHNFGSFIGTTGDFFRQNLNPILNKLKRKKAETNSINVYADYAFTTQQLFEELLLELINDLHKKYPQFDNIVVSGGIFANVKANQKINELPWVKEMYVYPPMGDMGLGLGSAIYKSVDLGYWKKPKEMDNVFFGLSYTNDEVLQSSKKYNFVRKEYIPSEVANLLANGKIVGFFKGKFEYGPRALGARSILMRVTDSDGFEKLNNRLGRHEVMPFAPVVLDEYASEIFDIKKSRYTAEFMTMCFNTKQNYLEKIPAVVHAVDNTSRPQIVVKHKNPHFYEIVDEYRKVSGLPILLNTSFNGHNEPIINSPDEAFNHLEKGTIDYLVIEDFLFYKTSINKQISKLSWNSKI
jgi:carbamoyltransferase